MKSFVRWGTTLCLIGSIVFGTLFVGRMPALALTEAQVSERLRRVPVFILTGAEGALLVDSTQSGSSVAGVFISQQDAQTFLNNLRQNNPDLAQDVRITLLSLAEVYELAVENQVDSNRLQLDFIPIDQQVQGALTVLRQNGQTVEQFADVPLFYLAGQDGGYLTIQDKIPMFFEQEGLQELLTVVRQQQPNVASTVRIEVGSLENLIQRLQDSNTPESDEVLNRILLYPPRSSVELIQEIRQQQGDQQQPGNSQPSTPNQAAPNPPAQRQSQPNPSQPRP